MSEKTNDEKLRILQERLAQIKEKRENTVTPKQPQEESNEATTEEHNLPQQTNTLNSFKWLKYIAIIGICGYGIFYAYNSINLNKIESEETNITKADAIEAPLKYDLELTGDNIVIIGTFETKDSAKVTVNNLNIKGFKADYFYLPNKSNSTKEVYKVFIGPYENKEETNQWLENIESEFNIITL